MSKKEIKSISDIFKLYFHLQLNVNHGDFLVKMGTDAKTVPLVHNQKCNAMNLRWTSFCTLTRKYLLHRCCYKYTFNLKWSKNYQLIHLWTLNAVLILVRYTFDALISLVNVVMWFHLVFLLRLLWYHMISK